MGFGETFKALADPARRKILELLKSGKLSAGEIAGHFDMTQATVSYHLKILKKADLIRDANSHFLRTAGPHFPDSPGHIKRTAWDISRAEGTPPH